MRVAISYDRFSSGPQKKGTSKERQDYEVSETCKREGWTLHATLCYRDPGCSAFRGKHRLGKHRRRGGLQDLLEAVQNKVIKTGWVIVIESFSRLSREPLNTAFNTFQGILHKGVDICICQPFRLYTRADLDDAGAMAVVNFEMDRAHQEAKQRSRYAKAQWKRIHRQAGTLKPHRMLTPPWIRLVPCGMGEDCKANDDCGCRHEFIPARRALLEKIIAWYRGGEPLGAIHRTLQGSLKKYPPWGRAKAWCRKSLTDWLRSPALYGAYQRHETSDEGKHVPVGAPVEGYYPAILTKEEFEDLQALMRQRGRRASGRPPRSGVNLLQGMVKDSEGFRLLLNNFDGGKVGYSYLVRARDDVVRKPSPQHRVPYQILETLVLRLVPKLTLDDLTPPEAVSQELDQTVTRLRAERDALKQRVEALQSHLEDPHYQGQGIPELAAALRKVKDQHATVDEQLANLHDSLSEASELTLEEAQSLATAREKANPEERADMDRRLKTILPSLVEGAWVHVQPINHRCRWIHVQVWLRSGVCHYSQLYTGSKEPAGPPLDLSTVDLREGYPRKPSPKG